MLSYDAVQDVLSAVLVIVVVSVVVALAWLSTYVREQPTVTAAVVVFQSDASIEPNTGMEQNQRETSSNGEDEGTTSEEFVRVENKSKGANVNGEATMDAKERTDLGASGGKEEKENVENSLRKDQETGDLNGINVEGNLADIDSKSVKSDETLSNPSQDTSEMEVRRRRLQQFIAMGEMTTSHGKDENTLKKEENKTEAAPISGDATTSEAAEAVPSEDDEDEATRPPGTIKIRLKFLDDTQRFVFAQPSEQVGNFKRQHFSIEMDAKRRIRLIFNGRLLSKDTSTLEQYRLFDNCVVHCHVSQPQPRPAHQQEPQPQDEDNAYVGHLLAPLLYLVMGVMWYLRYGYGHLFNTMSTVILLFLTALLLFSTYLLYITQNVHEARPPSTHTHHDNTAF